MDWLLIPMLILFGLSLYWTLTSRLREKELQVREETRQQLVTQNRDESE